MWAEQGDSCEVRVVGVAPRSVARLWVLWGAPPGIAFGIVRVIALHRPPAGIDPPPEHVVIDLGVLLLWAPLWILAIACVGWLAGLLVDAVLRRTGGVSIVVRQRVADGRVAAADADAARS